jgi:hypothetical protein
MPRYFLYLEFFFDLSMRWIVRTATWPAISGMETMARGCLFGLRGSTSVSSSSFCNANVLLFNSDLMLHFTFGLS